MVQMISNCQTFNKTTAELFYIRQDGCYRAFHEASVLATYTYQFWEQPPTFLTLKGRKAKRGQPSMERFYNPVAMVTPIFMFRSFYEFSSYFSTPAFTYLILSVEMFHSLGWRFFSPFNVCWNVQLFLPSCRTLHLPLQSFLKFLSAQISRLSGVAE